MKRVMLTLLVFTLASASRANADSIHAFHIQLGSWNGSTFTSNGDDWNTNGPGWAIGVTGPALGDSLLTGYQSVNLPFGAYYLYAAQTPDSGNAISLTVGFASSASITEIFTATGGGSTESHGGYILVSGAGFGLNLVTAPQTTYSLVGNGPTVYTGGPANWVVGFNDTPAPTPEPNSGILLLTGIGLPALVAYGRRDLRKRRYPLSH
ncbi:MAG: hypothetical protein M3O31_11670 [Acidobacteriota bacterium]|nr:hypothetical protein [Acidobacteriota bacterium]